jgi:hypothetical protein
VTGALAAAVARGSGCRIGPHCVARWLALTVVTALVAACATLGHLAFQEPAIALKEIAFTSIGLTGGTCDLVFDVWNPNAYRITSTRMEVGIDLEGNHFGDALLERPLDLSATAHSEVRVPVRFEWAGLGAGAKALLTKRAVAYAVTGRVLLDTPVGTETVVLKGTGNVPLTKLFK